MTKKWDEIRKGSSIVLEKDTIFTGFDGDFVLRAGKYFITGFWANACGLAKNKGQDTFRHIPAIQLKRFKGVA